MSVSEIRVKVRGLQPGMYVVKLDRPWLETPHLTQGFAVKSADDVERISQYSEYVYIDAQRGPAPESRFVLPLDADPTAKPLAETLPGLDSQDYEKTKSIPEELVQAREVQLDMEHLVTDTMRNLQDEKQLDMQVLRNGVRAMTASIIRNPEALVWLSQLKEKDSYSYNHSIGTSVWAATFARFLGLPKPAIDLLALGGLLLDVGKSALPEEILQSPARLTLEEIETVRSHVQFGLGMIERASGIDPQVQAMVATHHERFDGSGYPQGLRGEEIPIFGRIAAVVDTYDALTSRRAYANAMSPHGAINVLYQWRGIEFQPELVERFIQAVGIYPAGTLVELSNGQVGVITSTNDRRRLRPRIMLLLDSNKKRLAEFNEVDLMEEPAAEDGAPLDIKRGLPPGSYDIDARELFL